MPADASRSRSSRSPIRTVAAGRSASTSARADATAATISAPTPVEELAERHQQIGVGGNADAQEAGHEMGIDHRVLQLRPLTLDAGRSPAARRVRSSAG
jgi:hypothetical protein